MLKGQRNKEQEWRVVGEVFKEQSQPQKMGSDQQ
jgi:hypothetical protein